MTPFSTFITAAVLALTAGASSAAPAKPQRVMSLNGCTDQLVLMLLPPERIVSVSYLAEKQAMTPELKRRASHMRVNHGLAEEVLQQKPDLILTSPFSARPAHRLMAKTGAPMVDVMSADSFEDIRRTTRQVAAAVGEVERGEVLIAAMDAKLAELKRTIGARKILAMGWDGSGRVPGKQSLFNDILTAAGGVNLAAGEGSYESSLDLEQLLAANPRPQLLLYAENDATAPTLQTASIQHPVLRRAFTHRLEVPRYGCGTPDAGTQAAALRRAMEQALAGPGARP